MPDISVKTNERTELIDITSELQQIVDRAPQSSGLLYCFVPHTTAAITINENADPDVKRDILYKLNREFPKSDGYHHAEGNSDAHIKASLVGFSETILFENGHLQLGTWQGVYFCEFDGPRTRKLTVRFIPIAED